MAWLRCASASERICRSMKIFNHSKSSLLVCEEGKGIVKLNPSSVWQIESNCLIDFTEKYSYWDSEHFVGRWRGPFRMIIVVETEWIHYEISGELPAVPNGYHYTDSLCNSLADARVEVFQWFLASAVDRDDVTTPLKWHCCASSKRHQSNQSDQSTIDQSTGHVCSQRGNNRRNRNKKLERAVIL